MSTTPTQTKPEEFDYHIIANLGMDRNKPGTLKVYDKQGRLVMQPVPALGRGTNHQQNGYDHTQQLKRNADTPSGVSRTQIIGRGSATDSFGPHERVHLYSAISGNFLKAEKAGRREILIHGGKQKSTPKNTWYPLHPTYGCIRLSNTDMGELIRTLKSLGKKGKITIS